MTEVAYVIQGEEVSGAERMHAALIRADSDALVICPAGSGAEEFARELGAQVAEIPFRQLRHSAGPVVTVVSMLRGLRTAAAMRRTLRAHPERVVLLCTTIRAGMVAALASAGTRRRLCWCVPDFLPPAPLSWVVRLMVRRTASSVICLSKTLRSDLTRGSARLEALSHVVYPGVEPVVVPERGAQSEPPTAAIVGHVSPVKRTDLAVDVAAIVAVKNPGFRLRIIGRALFRDEDFELESALRRRAATTPELLGVVEFADFQADIPAALADAALLLHCRTDEPFGIALVEAMAAGKPVVAPAAAGPLEIVEHGVTGLLYEPGNAHSAASAIESLISDDAKRREMGRAAQQRARVHFGVERQLKMTHVILAQ